MFGLLLHALLIGVILAGIALRSRWRASMAFPLYLLLGAAHKVAQLLGLADATAWASWLLVDLSQTILSLCVAVEIAARVFHRDLPGGRTYTGRVLVVVLGLGLLAVLLWGRALTAASDHDLYFALVEAGRRVALTAAATFAVVGLLVISYFNWHLDPYHAAVGAGFVAYAWVYILAAPWARGFTVVSPEVWPVWVYGAVLCWWALAAWRPVDTLGLSPEEWALGLPWQKVKS